MAVVTVHKPSPLFAIGNTLSTTFAICVSRSQLDKNDGDSMAAKREAIAKAERAFKLFDKDNDGYITKDEFQKISKKLNREQIEAVFAKFDRDGDGVLSFEEFRRMLNKDHSK